MVHSDDLLDMGYDFEDDPEVCVRCGCFVTPAIELYDEDLEGFAHAVCPEFVCEQCGAAVDENEIEAYDDGTDEFTCEACRQAVPDAA
jgi:hypothetical protein